VEVKRVPEGVDVARVEELRHLSLTQLDGTEKIPIINATTRSIYVFHTRSHSNDLRYDFP
jgi:hypothetical protein